MCQVLLVVTDTVLCCSVVLSEWMFELAAQLDAAKYGESLLLNCYLIHCIMCICSIHERLL